jgi:hypothetical protein
MSGTLLARRPEPTRPGDRYADYCLWDYRPPRPTAGKLRSASLLRHSFDVAAAGPAADAICAALREGLGPFRTVWGVKLIDGRLSWELYFYDYERLERQVSIRRVMEILRPFAGSALSFPESRPYFMFSLDLDQALFAGRRGIEEMTVYLGNPGSSVSSGIGYNVGAEGIRLDNFYFFFDARREFDDIRAKVACSAHLDLPRAGLDDILWPELIDCQTIVVANKKFSDSVYFSRITVDQLLVFFERLAYPAEIRRFVAEHRDRLDHLLYDVGIDYVTRGGRVEIVKSGYYGLF